MTRLISVNTIAELPEVFKNKVEFHVVDDKIEGIVFRINDKEVHVVAKDVYSNTLKVLAQEHQKIHPLVKIDYEYDEEKIS